MSQNYCVQLGNGIEAIAITTIKPVNFPSLQFSLSVNSLIIFLFSKYPFNFNSNGNIYINEDEFGFAQVGQNFNIDLSNYQGYYMLILIYPTNINVLTIQDCQAIQNLTMTFQNTTISPIQNETIIANLCNEKYNNFCTCYQKQKYTVNIACNNQNYIPIILLDNLNNQLLILQCMTFVYQNNTTVEFAIISGCSYFGSSINSPIIFNANQEVIDFLENNNFTYETLSVETCQLTTKIFPCTLPCKSVYLIRKLLNPPKKYSLISSKLWNEIVSDLYLAYSIFKYIKYLSQFPYAQNIIYAINDFYNFYENFQPYIFKPLIKARKGLPLTADYFNSLIDAIIELADFANIQLQKGISHVQPDQVVKSLQFDDIVYDVNQLLTFNYYQYFLFSCDGYLFYYYLYYLTTFLNVLISNLEYEITIPNNVYIKNLLIYAIYNTIDIFGTIDKFIIVQNNWSIIIDNNAYINILKIYNNNGEISFNENANVNIFQIENNNSTIETDFNDLITIFEVENNNGVIALHGNTQIQYFYVNQNFSTISVNDNVVIGTLIVEYNNGDIQINGYNTIENLICKQNNGTVSIASTATIINNQCS